MRGMHAPLSFAHVDDAVHHKAGHVDLCMCGVGWGKGEESAEEVCVNGRLQQMLHPSYSWCA